MVYRMEKYISLSYKVKLILSACVFFVLIAVSWFAYTWYITDQAKKAQLLLSECLDEYQKTVESKDPVWSELVIMNDLATEQAHFEPFKPYLLIMKAQALARQGQSREALDAVSEADSMISSELPYKAYYALTKSLIQIDAQDEQMQKDGFEQLQQLAYDTANIFRDAALFHLAAYYQAHNQPMEVANIVSILENDPVLQDSLWVARAKEYFVI